MDGMGSASETRKSGENASENTPGASPPSTMRPNSMQSDNQRPGEPVEITRRSSHGRTRSNDLLCPMPQDGDPAEDTRNFNEPQLARLDPTSVRLAEEDRGWTRLHAAVEAGDHDLVRKLMEEGESLESIASDGRKPLLIAAEKGFNKIVELLATSASVEAFNEHDRSTALLRACQGGHEAVVKSLIERGANIEAKNTDGWTPLFFTVASRNHNLVKYLLQHGADKTVVTKEGTSAEDLAEDDGELRGILQMNHLLQGPEIGVKKSDPEPHFRYVRAPEKPKEPEKVAACEAIHAEVVQFFIGHREQRSQPVSVSVYDLIYGEGPNALFNPSPAGPNIDSSGGPRPEQTHRGQPTFTWYHIPANNVRSTSLQLIT